MDQISIQGGLALQRSLGFDRRELEMPAPTSFFPFSYRWHSLKNCRTCLEEIKKNTEDSNNDLLQFLDLLQNKSLSEGIFQTSETPTF